MDYREFLCEVKEQIQMEMGTGYEVAIRKVTKNNGVMLDGLSVNRKAENLAPVVYLNSYYEQLGNHMTLSEIIDDILLIYKKFMKGPMRTAEDLSDFGYLRDKVVFKLIQADSNRELLVDTPNVAFLDMAIVFYLLLDQSEMGHMTALIHNSHLGVWNTTEEELYRLAKINTPKLLPAKIKTMKEVMYEMLMEQFGELSETDIIGEVLEDMPDKLPLYVLTNQCGTCGAGCILYEGCLEEFAKEKEADIIILPSSIHEVLLTIDRGDLDYEELEEMVKQINNAEVPVEDVLSNRIYRYFLGEGRISIVSTQ